MKDNLDRKRPKLKVPGRVKIKVRVNRYAEFLREFSNKNGIPNLQDRVKRGMNIASMLALSETSSLIQDLCSFTGANFEEVMRIALDLQTGGPWKYVERFKDTDDPTMRVVLSLINIESLVASQEKDLEPHEFLKNIIEVKSYLKEALEDFESFFEKTLSEIDESADRFIKMRDGVPISEKNNGFLYMALKGFEQGIGQDSDGIIFIGSKDFDDSILIDWGLKPVIKEDRGRQITFYENSEGTQVIKRVHKGFLVILNRNLDLAVAIVKRKSLTTEEKEHLLEFKRYMPTSYNDGWKMPEKYIESSPFPEPILEWPELSQEERILTVFFEIFRYVRSNEILNDTVSSLKMAAAKKIIRDRKLTETDSLIAEISKTITINPEKIQREILKIQKKQLQKTEEMKRMVQLMTEKLSYFTKKPFRIVDAAAGSGDAGMSIGLSMILSGWDIKQIILSDVVPEYIIFNETIIESMPQEVRDTFGHLVDYQIKPIQEMDFSTDSIIVSKHPCGTLADSIIDKWTKSKSPALIIMTCCHDKASLETAQYGFTQAEWGALCQRTALTSSSDEAKRLSAMEAMDELDRARISYLQRLGFRAELIKDPSFPKGNVIFAYRIPMVTTRENPKVQDALKRLR